MAGMLGWWNKLVNGILAGMLAVALLLATAEQAPAQEAGWSTPVMISTNTVSSWFPDVAVDDWGRPHIVWNSGRMTEQGPVDLLMYSTLVDQGWLEPNDIAVTAYGGYTVRPAVAVDPMGTLHVTFRGKTTIYYTDAPVSKAWSAASWSPRRLVSGAGAGAAYYSDVAVDDRGGIHVVWNESVSNDVQENWLWFGTLMGVVLYDGRNWQSQGFQAAIGDRRVYDVAEDSAGVQWFGTDQGLYSFDGVAWKAFTTQDGLAGQQVYCVAQDVDGRLWFGTDGGFSLYDKAAQEESDKWEIHSVWTGLPDNMVHAVAIDPVGRVWAGTRKGLASYDGQNWVNYTPQDGLAAAEVLAVAVDDQGNVWAGTAQGVSQYDGKRWITYTSASGLLSNAVTAMVIGRDGTVWVGTDAGLSRFDGREWTSYTAEDGMPQGAVTALIVDRDGVVWVATETGVSRYDGQAWQGFGLPEEVVRRGITAIAEDRRVNAMCQLCADVFYRRSTDGGKSWSVPINLSNSFAGSVKPQVRVGTEGNVYVTWEEGEDWYADEGYPVGCAYAYSLDGGETWTRPTIFSYTLGIPQQITLGVGQGGNLVVVWRLSEEESSFYYQLSSNNGATWSEPRGIPGLIAKARGSFSLDAYDAATDSAGNVHLLALGHRFSLEEDLGLFHLVWNGSEWSSPALIYASNDPPEWPRIDIGAGNQVYATWFTRDERHINDSDRARYKVWASFYQASAPPQTPVPLPTPSPTPAPDILERTMPTPVATPIQVAVVNSPGLPSGLDTESDEIGWLALALSPAVTALLIVVALRFVRLKR